MTHQWGWGGYTTQVLERCNLSARAFALIDIWWSEYVRRAHTQARRKPSPAVRSCSPGSPRLTEHAGQSRLLLTLTHAASDLIKAMIADSSQGSRPRSGYCASVTETGTLARYDPLHRGPDPPPETRQTAVTSCVTSTPAGVAPR